MEDGLRALTMAIQSSQKRTRLNPCSCGRWSQSSIELLDNPSEEVLILVLEEDGLRVLAIGPQIQRRGVLILVLVEDGLRVPINLSLKPGETGVS